MTGGGSTTHGFVGDGVLLLVLLMIGVGLWGVFRGMGRLAHVP